MTSQHDNLKTNEKAKKSPQKDLLLKETLKNHKTSIPSDEKFYENMHKDIMIAVEAIDSKKMNKWSQPFVFLEPGEVHDLEKNKTSHELPIKLPN